ncbi:hypothetical protein BDQ12DRAFT_726138 [Crucibulum laeve]|uniref:Uncharacterized protein n=1 Tax=Crucibulum laeve TaxID=68775 RepID=A0A5C3LRK9_9AGAR|nr:hypothetical protein BDQ12DRAFT_726138 [Crucibulum laeve]
MVHYTHQNAVIAFDTIYQTLIIHTMYAHLVSNWGDLKSLRQLVLSMLVEALFNIP